MSLRALGGGELFGSKLLRITYLDETGTGSLAKEPFTVVAGVMLHVDRDWANLAQCLSDMADDFALTEDRAAFVFHASELAGADPVFRAKYNGNARLACLRALCEVPGKFALPIAFGVSDRALTASRYPSATLDEQTAMSVAHAAINCLLQIDAFVTEQLAGEMTLLVFEQNGKKDKLLRDAVALLKSNHAALWSKLNPGQAVKQLRAVADTAHFVGKRDSPALQLADTVAHVLGRKIKGASYDAQCFDLLKPQLLGYPPKWASDMLS